jgi:metallophosphoesterase superfamily enzyme
VQGGNRLLMPAFGSYTGGMDAESREISALFRPNSYLALLVAEQELLTFPLPKRKDKRR